MRFNTAISSMMVLSKHLAQHDKPNRWALEQLVLLVSPYAPHLGEELWERLGHPPSVTNHAWPSFDEELAKDDELTIAVQVRGKVRGTIVVAPGTDKSELERLALAEPGVARHLEGQTIRKVIVVPDRIVNIVI